MSKELDRLELEVEAALAAFSVVLDVEPSEASVQRVRAAVRHELNEAWFAGQPAPTPPPEVLESVRAAVRSELEQAEEAEAAEPGRAFRPIRRFPWSALGAPLAAAAMIGICIGIIQRGRTVEPMPSLADPAALAEAKLGQFVEVAEGLFTEDPLTASIVADLDALEKSISQWEPTSGYEPAVLNDVVDEIDELLKEPDSDRGMSKRADTPRGALG